MNKAIDFLDVILKDDQTETGGVAFVGETLKDFIDSVMLKLNYTSSLEKVNAALLECGIKPIPAEIGIESVLETDIELENFDTDFIVVCRDGYGIAYSNETVLKLVYPKLDELTDGEKVDCLANRAILDEKDEVNYGDVMVLLGEIVGIFNEFRGYGI